MKLSLGTESIARAAARRPWIVVGVWVAVLAAAFVMVGALLSGALTNDDKMTNNPEATKAQTIIDERLGKSDNIDEMMIVSSKTLTVDDTAFKSQVEALFTDLTALGKNVVLGGATYYMTGDQTLVSADRHATLIPFAMPKDGAENIEQVYALTDKINAAGSFTVYNTGTASFNHDAGTLAEDTMKTGETIGISVALIVLAIVFGAIVAATMPIILGVVAILAALGLTALVGQAMNLTMGVTEIVTMMGLAVGIDYSLFILTRFREERQHGLNKIDAIARTGATASRAVLISGITVILALTGLVIFPMTIFQSFGLGAILVVFSAIVATLTLLPALLSIFGDKVNSLRIPFIQKRNAKPVEEENTGFWVKTTRLVTRRPVLSIAAVVIILGAAAIPFFSKESGMSGISGLPDSLRAKQGFNVLVNDFHTGLDTPAVIVVDGDMNSQAMQASIAKLQEKIAGDSTFTFSNVTAHPDKDLAVIYAGLSGDSMSKHSMDTVDKLRNDYIPAAFGGTEAEVMVTGETAFMLDFNQTTNNYTPIVFGFVLSLSFIILTLAFRSIVIPVTAIIMNMLSVGAAYGLLVLVFQKGIGASIFGFQQVDVIESWLPLFLFALLFGLSMDYHVFLLSRIRERYMKTGDNAEAVSFGLRSTGKLITGAALIMVAVFGGFALGDMVMFQQMGFGLAVAVLVDATLIRSVLVPATMKLLGKYNWYMPKWLNWLPNISLGENHEVEAAAAPAARPQPRQFPVGQVQDMIPVPINPHVRIERKTERL